VDAADDLVVGLLGLGQFASGGLLVRVAEAGAGVLEAEVDEGRPVRLGGDPVEGVAQAVVAGAGGVVFPARADRAADCATRLAKWVQPELTAAMDWYDRCITGLRLTPASTKSVDVAATLFETYRPRPACKDWPRDAVWPDHGIPRTVLLDRDAIEGPMADAAARVTGQGSAGPAGP
jgi:hypothetical protein